MTERTIKMKLLKSVFEFKYGIEFILLDINIGRSVRHQHRKKLCLLDSHRNHLNWKKRLFIIISLLDSSRIRMGLLRTK